MALCDSASMLLTPDISSRQDCVQQEAIENSKDGVWPTLLCIMALSSACGTTIQSCYPKVGTPNIEPLLNASFIPHQGSINNFTPVLNISWSCSSGKAISGRYSPDHFVPLFVSSIFESRSSLEGRDNSLQEHNSISDDERIMMSISKTRNESCLVNTVNDDNCLNKLSTSNDCEPLTSIESVKYQHVPESKKGRKGCSKSQSKITQFARKASSSNALNKCE